MSFDKESIKACCKNWLTWMMLNFKGLIMLGLGIFLLIYTHKIFLYFLLFVLGVILSYAGLREFQFTTITGFFDMVGEKIHNLCCKCKP